MMENHETLDWMHENLLSICLLKVSFQPKERNDQYGENVTAVETKDYTFPDKDRVT
jgi:hypothetical protein